MTPSNLHVGPAVAQAGDGDGGVGQLGAAQATAAGALHQVAKGLHELGQGLLVSIVDGGSHQTATAQGDGPAEVDAGAGAKSATLVEPIELRHFSQGAGAGLDEQRGGQQTIGRRLVAKL